MRINAIRACVAASFLIALSAVGHSALAEKRSAWKEIFTWSTAGRIDGQQCTRYDEGDYPLWDDNFFCTTDVKGIAYYHGYANPDWDCVLLDEPQDDRALGGHDNFLCVPYDSQFRLMWFNNGIKKFLGQLDAAMSVELASRNATAGIPILPWLSPTWCIQVSDGVEKSDIWHDNYLCILPRVRTDSDVIKQGLSVRGTLTGTLSGAISGTLSGTIQ